MSQLFDPDADYQESVESEYVRPLSYSGLDQYLTAVGLYPDAEPSEPCSHVEHDPLCHHCRERMRINIQGELADCYGDEADYERRSEVA